MRTWKASKLAWDTHKLERAEVGTCLNTIRKQGSEGTHSLETTEYEVRLQDTNKQAETNIILGVNPLSARENAIYNITTYPHPWKC